MDSRFPSFPPSSALGPSTPASVPPSSAPGQPNQEAAGYGGLENVGFYTGMVLSNDPQWPSLNDLNFPLTQDSQTIENPSAFGNNISSELQSDVVEVQPEVFAAGKRTKKGASHRQKKFEPEEDKVICVAWLTVSKDPINGANQGKSTFWGRIRAYFDEHKDKTIAVSVRTEASIMHRWLTIQREVSKFCACYEKIERRNASGCTIQDMIAEALEAYRGVDEENKSFTLMHCYHILKDEDKWKSLRLELGQKNKKQKTTKDSTPSNLPSSNNDEMAELATPGSGDRKRPPGQKQVKQARRDEASLAAIELMWDKKEARDRERDKARDKAREAEKEAEKEFLEVEKAALELDKKRLEKDAEIEKKRLEIEAKVAEANLLKEEKDIMLADTSKLDEEQLQWHKIMKKKILARTLGN